MKRSELKVGKTYHNGEKRQRKIVAFEGYNTVFVTPTNLKKGDNTTMSTSEFKNWAKGVVEDE